MWKEKVIVLTCHGAASGNVAAIPVRRKGDIHYMARSGQTPFFFVHWHDYNGKWCPFGEVVMAYVADDRRQKGSARWAPMLFLVKTENDMYIVIRSIKRIYSDMQQHLGLYPTIASYEFG